MNKSWDSFNSNKELQEWTEEWATEALRVIKPGGIMLCFAGSRTQHRIACGIEDAGWIIKDTIMWCYGSGFPKSLDVAKQYDKLDAVKMRRERDLTFTKWMRETGITAKQINEATQSKMSSHYLTDKKQPAVATIEMFEKIKHLLPEPPENILEMMKQRTIESENFKKREVIGKTEYTAADNHLMSSNFAEGKTTRSHLDITKGNTKWEGYGSALKPAYEPIIMAMKPKDGTYAENALKWNVAGLSIESARIGDGWKDKEIKKEVEQQIRKKYKKEIVWK